jgi:hypothetical protein
MLPPCTLHPVKDRGSPSRWQKLTRTCTVTAVAQPKALLYLAPSDADTPGRMTLLRAARQNNTPQSAFQGVEQPKALQA